VTTLYNTVHHNMIKSEIHIVHTVITTNYQNIQHYRMIRRNRTRCTIAGQGETDTDEQRADETVRQDEGHNEIDNKIR